MRRYFRHILLSLISVICTVSCIKELDDPNPVRVSDTPTVLVPRVKSFTNQYITKAGYTTDETQISSLTVLVFNNNGQLVHIQQPSNLSSIELNKSMLDAPDQDVTAATIVMIANVGLDKITDGNGNTFQEIKANKLALTLEGMENCTFDFSTNPVITSIPDDFDGFPMIGGVKNVNLSATKESQNAISVPLKILYAKINFSISVANGTENTGTGMQFTLNGYSVHNVANKTGMAIPTEKGEPVSDFLGEIMNEDDKAENDGATDSSDYTESGVTGSKTGTTNVSGQPITFTFYIAESRYNHNSDLKGIYPSDDWLTTDDTEDGQVKNGVKSFYDDLIQQYKPKLANVSTGEPAAGLASYVLLNGTYVDYRGTSWNVNYTVYLGKDNAQNFHVDRNSEYTNSITIKGIRNNDGYTETDDKGNLVDEHVWIDHRVNVSTNDPSGHVAITRETLIDSHIEVRPLRVSWPEGAYAGVRVYLPTNSDGTTPVNWIGIERFTGSNNQEGAVYCYQNGKSIGKRKYFTTGLISELQSKGGELGVQTDNGKKFIYLLNGECAWIYFDENTTTSDRTADIKLAFYSAAGSVQAEEIYQIKQRGLQSIGGYTVESYEEYLHSYDSADKYNLSTNPADYTQQGLSWGLANRTISKDIIVSATSLDRIQNYVDQRYDYFHKSDVPPSETYYTYQLVDGTWTDASYGTGLIFTDRASAKEGITIKDMGTVPDNAYQYCLSKNKFNEDADGNHTLDIHWYLPDVYELEAVLTASQTNTTAEDFGSDTYYWSSQPSFGGLSLNLPIINREVSIKEEVVKNARAVSVTDIKDVDRSTHNRIRCFYSATGIKADMTERTPDGIGGNYSFYMKAWNNAHFGYFNYRLPAANISNSETPYDFTKYDTTIPSEEDDGKFDYVITTDKNGNDAIGFRLDPSNRDNWDFYTTALGQETEYYTTLADYKGLSPYELSKRNIGEAYIETTTPKSVQSTSATTSTKKLTESLPSASNLKTLDHINGGNMFNISFNRSNGNNDPKFIYDELVSETKTTNTQYWIPPAYYGTIYPMTPSTTTLTESGSGVQSASSRLGKSQARREAFGGSISQPGGAYQKAKDDAFKKIQDEINENYQGWIMGTVFYYPEELTFESDNPAVAYSNEYEEGRYIKNYFSTCTVTLTASVTLTKEANLTLYLQTEGTGCWGNEDFGNPTSTPPVINTDELRMYCGNSFTISLNGEYNNTHEITKVTVYYSGDNFVDEGGTLNADKYYTRFVDSTISMPQNSTIPWGGSTETLQLPGMDYNDDKTSGTGTHQWAGIGRPAITLVLRDYLVYNNFASQSYTYTYDNAKTDLSKYIIIDKIEVKCTKKSTAEQ